MKLPFNSYYIIGASNNTVYLGNWTNAFHMIILNTESLDSQHVSLRIKDVNKFKDIQTFKLKIDSPYFYLIHGTMPAIFRGEISKKIATPFIEGGEFFLDAEPINKSTFAIKSFNTKSESLELGKERFDSTYFNYDVLEKQTEGIFSVDGILNIDRSNNKLVYTYKHRNQYIVMDTSLLIKYRSNTLDTFSRASIKVADIESENSKMLTGLPKYINVLASADNNRLYIKSNILAKNENLKSFIEGSTLDVFDTDNHTYIHSINLYNHNNKPLSDFEISKNKIITIYDDNILIHTINVESTTK